MKNYKLFKLRLNKTGVVFGANKFGAKWVELWYRGQFKVIKLEKPSTGKFLQKFVYKIMYTDDNYT